MTGLTSGALHGIAVEPVRNEKARRCSPGWFVLTLADFNLLSKVRCASGY